MESREKRLDLSVTQTANIKILVEQNQQFRKGTVCLSTILQMQISRNHVEIASLKEKCKSPFRKDTLSHHKVSEAYIGQPYCSSCGVTKRSVIFFQKATPSRVSKTPESGPSQNARLKKDMLELRSILKAKVEDNYDSVVRSTGGLAGGGYAPPRQRVPKQISVCCIWPYSYMHVNYHTEFHHLYSVSLYSYNTYAHQWQGVAVVGHLLSMLRLHMYSFTQSDELKNLRLVHNRRLGRMKALQSGYELVLEQIRTYESKG